MQAAKEVDIKQNGPSRFLVTVPSWVLALLVFGGIGTNTFNVYLIQQQIKSIDLRMGQLADLMGTHADQPAHYGAAKTFEAMERILSRIEVEDRASR